LRISKQFRKGNSQKFASPWQNGQRWKRNKGRAKKWLSIKFSRMSRAYADDDSEATADSAATAGVDQSQGFTVVQFNSALNDF
jgi:hypothetical protein